MTPDEFHGLRKVQPTLFGDVAYVEKGDGPAALFIHGLPLNGYHWRYALDRLSDRRRCIAPDLLGLGYTEAREGQPLDLESQAAMLLALMDTLDIMKFDLVGNDSGAGVAQIMAAKAPDRLRSLVLTNGDTHDNFPPPALSDIHNMAQAGRLGALMASFLDNPASAGATMASAFQYPERLGAEIMEVYLGPLKGRPDRQAQLDAYVTGLDNSQTVGIESRLQTLEAPTLVVWADQDAFFPTKWAYWLGKTIPGVRHISVLKGARLFFPEERPDEFLELVERHWAAA